MVVVMMMSTDELEMALRLAADVLDGKVDLVSGCRRILAYRSRISGIADETWDVFVAIASETDDFPVGDVRDTWDADALAAKDADVAAYVEEVRPAAREAFGEIVRVGLGVERKG